MQNSKIDILQLAKNLENGGIFIHPTDTIPGIGCLADQEEACKKISGIKNVSHSRKGFIGLIGSMEQGLEVYKELPEVFKAFLQKVWPGSFTFVYENHQGNTSALRMPKFEYNQWMGDLLKLLTSPLVSTSINISGHQPLKDWSQIKNFAYDHSIKTISDQFEKTKKNLSLIHI